MDAEHIASKHGSMNRSGKVKRKPIKEKDSFGMSWCGIYNKAQYNEMLRQQGLNKVGCLIKEQL